MREENDEKGKQAQELNNEIRQLNEERWEIRSSFSLLEWQIQEFRILFEKCWKQRKGTIESSAEEVLFEWLHHGFGSRTKKLELRTKSIVWCKGTAEEVENETFLLQTP